MAVTTAARALTEIHRRGQLRLRAVTIRDVLSVWPLLDLDDLARSWRRLERALLSIVEARGAESATLAATYFQAFRYAEGVTGTTSPVVAGVMVEEAAGSLAYTGLVNTRKLVAANLADARARALTNVTGDATRLVLNAGRDTITASVDADPRALGWARVTDGAPCSFCRMLAGRGPVYGEHGGFKAHGHCGCTAEPTYQRGAPWPGRAREFHDEWNQATAGLSGQEARTAYRQHVEGRQPVPAQ